MLMLASATQKEVESVSDNIEQLSKDVSKLSQIGSDLIDKAVAFGIDIIIAVIIFVIGKFIIKFILKFVDRIFAKSSADEGVAKFIHSVLKVTLYIILAITICGQVGIETTSFAAIVASGGLAIGLAFEGSLSNFAGGVMILIMKPFTVGDYIESNGVEGTVYKIDIFYTSLKTVDNKSVKLPNGTLSNSILTNYSMNEKRRVDVEVGIGYDDNIELARKELEKVMNSYSNIMRDESNVVVVKNLADSAIIMEVRVWVPTEYYWDCKFYLNEQIRVAFDKAGISIPFNQLDVNVHNVD
ncbi:mechanosensitive ion channel domain-containing protein [Eubacterium sp. AF19-12LB]|uniref:mechanosensitive ion channel family protein n=1 Tax=Eubacterium TaxID=1730 RepID=UPI000E4EC0E3|nr:mechanosensitive ion channel domain-containing protein [Eubacterium sp. AF19-12LB]RHR36456.1 mechanosensitive ion channel family protein [Eubacterium sp. AF19-12LB]